MSNSNDSTDTLKINPRGLFSDKNNNINLIKKQYIQRKLLYNENEINSMVSRFLYDNDKECLCDLDSESIITMAMLASDYHTKWDDMKDKGFELYETYVYLLITSKLSSRERIEFMKFDDAKDFIRNIDDRSFRLGNYYIFCADSYEVHEKFINMFVPELFHNEKYLNYQVLRINEAIPMNLRVKNHIFDKHKLQFYGHRLEKIIENCKVEIKTDLTTFEMEVKVLDCKIKMEFNFLLERIDNNFPYCKKLNDNKIMDIMDITNNIFKNQRMIILRENKKLLKQQKGFGLALI